MDVRSNAMSALDLLVFLLCGETIRSKDPEINFGVLKGVVIGLFAMLQKISIPPSEVVEELIQHYKDEDEERFQLFASLKEFAEVFDRKPQKDAAGAVAPTLAMLLSLFPLVLDGIENEKTFKTREEELQFLCCLIMPIAIKASTIEHATITAHEQITEFLETVGPLKYSPPCRLMLKGPNVIFDPDCLSKRFRDLGKYENDEAYYPPPSNN